MSPALAGGFLTTAPRGKPQEYSSDVPHDLCIFDRSAPELMLYPSHYSVSGGNNVNLHSFNINVYYLDEIVLVKFLCFEVNYSAC